MSDLKGLQASCKAILARHQRSSNMDLTCIVCQQRVRGQDSSMEHYVAVHGIHPTHFDDVADLDGFLAHLHGLIFPREDGRMHCPVCGEECGDKAMWAVHVKREEHTHWNVETIPALAPFCVAAVGVGETAELVDHGEDDNVDGGRNVDGRDEDDDGGGDDDEVLEGDWDVEPAICLLCDIESEDCLQHMIDAHGFDFRAAVRAHTGVKDVYDVIRVVNAIRKCVARGLCPHHYGDGAAEVETEACRRDIAASSLQLHLRAHAQHALPRVVPTGDRELIPVLCGDAFLSSVAVGGGLVLHDGKEEEEDPDYPMVPTIAEMAKRHVPRDEPPHGKDAPNLTPK
ncbi:Zinc finger Transcription Factor family member (ztf-7) [Trypanosoma grayi]|uniref:Zinc finger Transcription Factor family member (ztf-7) n=1 Tax=Trypanosoma grayi TaxID=71804 RepID=UPI0004F46343|nr:Zinc finger Transcription Factor family member (ztf-7) [Trypanosoma grayi]KEG14651.1 Zinc finger Transcription Factor family member (ztf-7) [Trypanosoma grayi]